MEFSLVGVVLTVLFLGLVQLGLALHIRNTVTACAADGARYGANADRTAEQGAAMTREMIRGALADKFAGAVSAGVEERAGVATVYVRVEVEVPVFGLITMPIRPMVVYGHALKEGVP